eukprot:m.83505 g.83505  ORF g.83505 m.83505 type:complete len:2989 (-) comp25641_c0_seq1:234-9200(-)
MSAISPNNGVGSPRKSAWDNAEDTPKVVERETTFAVTRSSFKKDFGFTFASTAGKRNVVTLVIKKSPADGIVKKNDRIVKVNGKDIKFLTQSEAEGLINKHLHIKLTVMRARIAPRQPSSNPKSNGAIALPGQLLNEINADIDDADVITPVTKPPVKKSVSTPRSRGPTSATRATNGSRRTTPKTTPKHMMTLSAATPADLRKELRARSGQKRKEESMAKERAKKKADQEQKLMDEKAAMEEALKHADEGWTPLQMAAKTREAKQKIRREREVQAAVEREIAHNARQDAIAAKGSAFPVVPKATPKPVPKSNQAKPKSLTPRVETSEEQTPEEPVEDEYLQVEKLDEPVIVEEEFDIGDRDFNENNVMRVRIQLKSDVLGFSLDPPARGSTIDKIKPGSDLEKDGRTKNGHVLIAISGVDVTSMVHGERVDMLRQCRSTGVLDITVKLQTDADAPRVVWVHKVEKLGFSVIYQAITGPDGVDVIHIFVWDKSPACVLTTDRDRNSADGAMHVGDQLVAINDTSVVNKDQPFVMGLLAKSLSPIKLSLKYNPEEFQQAKDRLSRKVDAEVPSPPPTPTPPAPATTTTIAPTNATADITKHVITLTRPTLKHSFGFGFGSTQTNIKLVTTVTPNGLAEGKLQVGDSISLLDDISCSQVTHAQMLQEISSRGTIQLTIERRDMEVQIDLVDKPTEVVPTSFEKLSVTLSRPSVSTPWGLVFYYDADGALCVNGVHYNSPAHNNIIIGDELSTIQGRNVSELSDSGVADLCGEGTELMLGITRATNVTHDTNFPPTVLQQNPHDDAFDMWAFKLQRSSLSDAFGYLLEDGTSPLQVSKITPGTVAVSVLDVGDQVLSILGVPTTTHVAALDACYSRTILTLCVRRPKAVEDNDKVADADENVVLTPTGRPRTQGETTEHKIILTKPHQGSFGFAFGVDADGNQIIKFIEQGGVADGKLALHDILVSVDGQPLGGFDHEATKAAFAAIKTPSIAVVVDRPLQVNLERTTTTESFGFGLGSTDDGAKVVTSVRVNGVSDGKLMVTDKIISVDGTLVGSKDHQAIVEMFSNVLQTTLTVSRNIGRRQLALKDEADRQQQQQPQRVRRQGSITTMAPQMKIKQRRDSIGRGSEEPTQIENLVVTLRREHPTDSFGFGVGSTFSNEKVITKVTPGGLSDGLLMVTDKILSVDGTFVVPLDHNDVIAMFRDVREVSLQVSRDLSGARVLDMVNDDGIVHRRSSIGTAKPQDVESDYQTFFFDIVRAATTQSFGFGIATTFSNEKLVSKVADGGLADGKLNVADKILQINDLHTSSMEHEALIEMLAGVLSMRVLVARDSKIATAQTQTQSKRRQSISAVQPHMVDRVANRYDDIGNHASTTVVITRPSVNVGFGFGFGSTDTNEKVVTQIVEIGPADGNLNVGDQILSVDGTFVSALAHSDVAAMFKDVLEVTLQVNRLASAKSNGEYKQTVKSAGDDSVANVTHGQDHFKVVVNRAHVRESFGFGIGTTFSNEKLITSVTDGGPSDGKLDVADKILVVNGTHITRMDHQDVVAYLAPLLRLEILVVRNSSTKQRYTTSTDTNNGTRNKRMSISATSPNQSARIVSRDDRVGGENFIKVPISRASLTDSFGFGVTSTQTGETYVSAVLEGGVSEGRLMVGDMIHRIDGASIHGADHKDVITMFSDVLSITLEVTRPQKDPEETLYTTPTLIGSESPQRNSKQRHVQVRVKRETLRSSFGFGVGSTFSNEKMVTKVQEGGCADGKVEVADKILRVNGNYVTQMDHQELMMFMGDCLELHMLLVRDNENPTSPSPIKANKRASISAFSPEIAVRLAQRSDIIGERGNITVVIDRPDMKTSFGFGIGTSDAREKFVTRVVEHGPAQNKLLLADKILAVNNQDVTSCEHTELLKLLSSNTRLEMKVFRDTHRESLEPARDLVDNLQLITLKRVNYKESFGFGFTSLDSGAQVVVRIEPTGPPTALEIGDEIVSCNGKTIASYGDNAHDRLIDMIKAANVLELSILRGAHAKSSIPREVVQSPTNLYGATVTRPSTQAPWGVKLLKLAGHHVIGGVEATSPLFDVCNVGDVIVSINGLWMTAERNNIDQMFQKALQLQLVLRLPDVTTIEKPEHATWGLGFASELSAHVVEALGEGTVCAATDGLGVGDLIVGVGATPVVNGEHVDVIELIKQSGTTLTLRTHKQMHVFATMIVEIECDENGAFGISLGTTEANDHKIVKLSPLAEQVLVVNDRVMQINNKTVHGVSHAETAELMRNSPSPMLIALQRPCARVDVKVTRSSLKQPWGFGIGVSSDKNNYITNISPNSCAEGVLFVGDLIDAVEQVPAIKLTHDKIIQKCSESTVVKLCVFRPQPAARVSSALGKKISKFDSISKVRPDLKVGRRNNEIGSVVSIAPVELMTEYTYTIKRPTSNSSFGFGISTTEARTNLVSFLTDGSPSMGKLQEGDVFKAANGHNVLKCDHETLVKHIGTGLEIEITVLRKNTSEPSPSSVSTPAFQPHVQPSRSSLATVPEDEGAEPPIVTNQTGRVGATTDVVLVIRRSSLDQSFGFGIGHTDERHCLVTSVEPSGISFGKLEVADHMVQINGRNITDWSHQEVINAVIGAFELSLVVRRSSIEHKLLFNSRRGSITNVLPGVPIHDRHDNLGAGVKEIVKVTLTKTEPTQSFGFGLGETQDGNHVISKIGDSSPATGKLMAQDVIVTVCGIPVNGMKHAEVVDIIKEAEMSLELELERIIFPEQAATAAVPGGLRKLIQAPDGEPVVVEWEVSRDTPRSSFGFGVGTAITGEKVVTHVNPDGPAAGIAFVADRFITVNGTFVDDLSHEQMLQCFTSELVCAVKVERNLEDLAEITEMQSMAVAKRRVSISEIPHLTNRIKARRESVGRINLSSVEQPAESSAVSLNVRVERSGPEQKWGFSISEKTTDDLEGFPICSVEDESPANSKLYVDDVVISANSESFEHLTFAEALHVLTTAENVIEFIVLRSQ